MSYIKSLFKDLGIIKHIDKDKINIACLIHNEKNGQSLYINFSKNTYNCFGKCQCYGTLQDLLLKIGIHEVLDNQYLIESLINQKFEEKIVKDLEELDFSKHLYFSNHPTNTKDIKYLDKRGLSKEIYQANNIYQNEYSKRIVIPVMFEGKYYGDITRTIYKEEVVIDRITKETGIEVNNYNKKDFLFELLYENNPLLEKYKQMSWQTKWHERYLNDYFLPKDRVLYEPLTNNPDVNVYLLQEGSIDALYSNQYGYNSYAVIGNGINQFHIDYLMKNLEGKILISAFDNDLAGSKFHNTLCKLSKRLILKLDWNLLNRKVKDVPDLSKEELDYLVLHATY